MRLLATAAILVSGLHGTVTKGPTAPVCRVGQPCSAPAQVTLLFRRLGHVSAACAGLSPLIVAAAIAFSTVKYVGAAYLIAIGIKKWLEKDDLPDLHARPPRSAGRVFTQGVVVNVLNPKTALFFLAFLP